MKRSHTEYSGKNRISYSENNKKQKQDILSILYEDLKDAIVDNDVNNATMLVKSFIEYNHIPNCIAYKDATPLCLAMQCNNGNIIRVLFHYGVNPFAAESEDLTLKAFFQTAYHDRLDALIALLEHKSFSYDLMGDKFRTLLHFAVLGQAKNVFSYLLKNYGHDKNFFEAQDEFGETALHKAVYVKDPVFIEALLRCGIDPEIPNSKGITAKQSAEKITEIDLVSLFPKPIDVQARISSPNYNQSDKQETEVLQQKIQELTKQNALLQQNMSALTYTLGLYCSKIDSLEKRISTLESQQTPQQSTELLYRSLTSVLRNQNPQPNDIPNSNFNFSVSKNNFSK